MPRQIFLFSLLILVGCSYQTKSVVTAQRLPDEPERGNHRGVVAPCFAGIDASRARESIGCSAGFFGVIDDKHVVGVFPELLVQFDRCQTVDVDSSNARLAELWAFDSKDAVICNDLLANICTDLIVDNCPKPDRKLYAQSGQLIIAFSDLTELYGHQTHRTTVLIKNLVFVDSRTAEKIELKNELLWKVLDLGTPG